MNALPPTPKLATNGNKCAGTGVTFNATGGTAYQWTGAFNGQTGSSKTSATTAGNYTTSIRNYVSANGITCYSAYTGNVTGYVNATPATPRLTQNGPKKGTGVTFTATGGTNYQWTGAFNGQTGNPKTSSTATGNYTTSVRNYVTANGITCYSAYTSSVTGVVQKAGPTIPGVTWTNTQVLASQYNGSGAQSACPSGMRLPTQAEFQKMFDAGSTWRTANSGYGNTENGRFFGSNSGSCTVANGNCVFLPARGDNGNGDTSYGNYWSSTQYPSITNYAYNLTFNNGYSNVIYYSKTYNFSILCVQ